MENYKEIIYENMNYIINPETRMVYGVVKDRKYGYLLLTDERQDEISKYYIQQLRLQKLNSIINE